MIHLQKRFIPFFLVVLVCLIAIFRLYQHTTKDSWWQVATNGEIYAPPSYGDDKIYIGNNEAEVKAINIHNGKIEWQNQYESEVQTEIATYKEKAFILTQAGILHCVYQNNGKELWNFSTNNQYNLITKPFVLNHHLIVGSTEGSIYALDPSSGKQIWKFDSNPVTNLDEVVGRDSLNWFGSLDTDGKHLFYSSRDGYLYALNSANGKQIWKYQLGLPNRTSVTLQQNEIVAGLPNGDIHIVNKNKGQLVHKIQIDSVPIQCIDSIPLLGALDTFPWINSILKLFPHSLSIITTNGKFYTLSGDRQTIIQMYDHQKPLSQCPLQIHQTKYILDKDGTLTALDMYKNAIMWKNNSNIAPSFNPIIFNRFSQLSNTSWFNNFPFGNVIIFGDYEGNIRSFLARSGKPYWLYKNIGIVKSQPLLHKKNLYFTDTAGRLSTIFALTGKTPLSLNSKKMIVTQDSIPLGDNIFTEFTLHYDQSYFPNPWNQIKVEGYFYHPELKASATVDGFYYDLSTWKIRFNPPFKGGWEWRITFRLPDQRELVKHGMLTSTTDTDKAYIKVVKSTGDSQKFTLDGQTQFYPLGMQEVVTDTNGNGSVLDDWSLNTPDTAEHTASFSGYMTTYRSGKVVSLDDYLQTFSDHGKIFNTYRFGVNNASFSIFNMKTINYQLLVQQTKSLDTFFSKLRNNSVHIWLSLFSFHIPYSEPLRPTEAQLLTDYTKYMIARYGVYTDVWEIANEATISDQLTSTIAATIRAKDFENRPITISWEKPKHKDISIVSLHDYKSDDFQTADYNIRDVIEPAMKYGKPIVFSEYGNQTTSWDSHSNDRLRIKNWTAFFYNTSLIYWNQTSKIFYNAAFNNANIYVGEDERLSIATLNSITQNIPLDATRMNPHVPDPSVRAYGIESSTGQVGYFVCTQLRSPDHKFQTLITIPHKGTFTWINPATGKEIQKVPVSPGPHTLTSPRCFVDLIYTLNYDSIK